MAMAVDVQHVPSGALPIHEAWSLISRLLWEMRARTLEVAGELGLTPPQMFALRALDPARHVPMRELAARLCCDSSNVTGLVDRLAAQGLVERRDDPRDRRVRMLALTERGAQVRERLESVILAVPAQLAGLNATDQRALRDIMRRAVEPDTQPRPDSRLEP